MSLTISLFESQLKYLVKKIVITKIKLINIILKDKAFIK